MSVMADEPKTTPKLGRPKGAKNIRNFATVTNSRCRNCGSTERTDYENTRYIDRLETGTQFNDGTGLVVGIRHRTCACKVCKVQRVERDFFYAPDGDKFRCVVCDGYPVKCIDAEGNAWCAAHLPDKDESDG